MTSPAAWLSARSPAPPASLAAHMVRTLAVEAAGTVGSEEDGMREGAGATQAVHEALLAAGTRLLGDLLARDAASRDAALDLLTADALVTYAFEAAAEEPDGLEAAALDAMRRVAALGSGARE